jgi:DNA polymerase/3'-5' exonuclease PolX
MDFRRKIVEELDILRQNELQNRNVFKARAYSKVITCIQGKTSPVVTMDDISDVDGVGDKIRTKIQEIISTGELAAATHIKQSTNSSLFNELIAIHGIGPVKANAILKDTTLNIQSIQELRVILARKPKLLNDVQKIGLKHYEDLLQRIPRDEMKTHEHILRDAFRSVNPLFMVTLVGSYRRGLATSGDIDVLICLPDSDAADAEKSFHTAVCELKRNGYIADVLALGPKKCMAVVKKSPDDVARRLDVLLTTPVEYPYAMLYFTGSDKFNIYVRKKTLEKGYSISEHGAKTKDGNESRDIPAIKTEKDIFAFFQIPYVEPQQRCI